MGQVRNRPVVILIALLTAIALAVTPGCGGNRKVGANLDSRDLPSINPPSGTNGLVHVYSGGNESSNVATASYGRGGREETAWTSLGDSGRAYTFDRLDTYQYFMEPNQTFDHMQIDMLDSNTCVSAFRGKGFEAVKLDDKGKGQVGSIFSAPTPDKPVHITFMYWNKKDTAGGCDIGQNFGGYQEKFAVAVWLSVKSYWDKKVPANATVCNLEADPWRSAIAANRPYHPATDNVKFKGSTDDCNIDPIGNKNYNSQGVWGGTLFTMLTDVKKSQVPLFINLGEGQTFWAKLGQVLNSEYQVTENGKLVYKVFETDRPIIITGTSVIDGDSVQGCGDGCTNLMGEMLVVSSRYDGQVLGGFAIDVSGVAVANAPSLSHGAVRLNDATLPMYQPGGTFSWNATNHRVKVFDLKRPGTWNTASDGIEPGADGSVVSYAYMHVNDDSIKVPANVNYYEITLLQGGAGAAINLGSYGYGRGVTNATIDGVYVHRIANNVKGDDDGLGALVTTRTCPIQTYYGDKDRGGRPQTLTGITIKNVFVNALGIDDAAKGVGPNQVLRIFALGVMGTNDKRAFYCHLDKQPVAQVTLGSVNLSNVNVFINPQRGSFMYDRYQSQMVVNGPISFCELDPNKVNSCVMPPPRYDDKNHLAPVTVWPNGSFTPGAVAPGTVTGYFMCSADATHCWNLAPGGNPQQAAGAGAGNIAFDPQTQVWGGKLVFPYS